MAEKKERRKKKVKEKEIKKEKVLEGNKEFSKEKTERYEKQTKVAVIAMVSLIALILFSNWVIQESKKFNYDGFEFTAEKEGSATFYKSLLGYVTGPGESVPFVLKLRNDPRDLDGILVEGKISPKNNEVIITLSPEITNCSNTYITMMDLARTLKAFGKISTAGTTDREYSKENDIPLSYCGKDKEKTIIVIKEGNETKITTDKSPYTSIKVEGSEEIGTTTKYLDCYTIELANCEIQQGFERFVLKMIEDSRVG